MPRLFIGNFEFEHRLAPSENQSMKLWQSLPAQLSRINAELATVLLALAKDDDYLLLPEIIEQHFFDQAIQDGLPKVVPITLKQLNSMPSSIEVVAWGVTSEIFELTKSKNWSLTTARLEQISEANSRMTAFQIAKNLGVLPLGVQSISTLDGIEEAIEATLSYSDQWIMKAEFGMSGRERITGQTAMLAENQKGWISKRLAGNQKIILEPSLSNEKEVSWHWEIQSNASPKFLGFTELFNNERGEYRGNRVLSDENEIITSWKSSFEATQLACEQIKQLGYFGPISIDSMKYKLKDGSIGYHSLMDINARYTMGRMALEYQKRLAPNNDVAWSHMPSSIAGLEDEPESCPIQTIETTPMIVGGTPSNRKTFLKIYK